MIFTCCVPQTAQRDDKAGRAPEDVQELGPEAWQTQGLKVLGTPIGTPECVAEDE